MMNIDESPERKVVQKGGGVGSKGGTGQGKKSKRAK
jgi:hypothetical protein